MSILVLGKDGYENSLDLCLAARAFGASNVTFVGRKNPKLSRQFSSINSKWGGSFSVTFVDNWQQFLKEKKNYKIVYLTRFGVPVNKVKYSIKTYKNIMLVVTLTESYKNLYKMADFNVSITSQPHCSTAAIAVFLHAFYEGRELAMHFENAKWEVIPEEHKVHVEKIS